MRARRERRRGWSWARGARRSRAKRESHGWVKGCMNMGGKGELLNRGANEAHKVAMPNELAWRYKRGL